MIGALKALFASPADSESETERNRRLRLAAAALLIETARADFTQAAAEEDVLPHLLSHVLDLDEQAVQALVDAAGRSVDEATSLYEYTRLINDYYSAEEKLRLIQAMWAVAYADGDLDKYEEHLIRRVAELTYVSHADYIRAKLGAQP